MITTKPDFQKVIQGVPYALGFYLPDHAIMLDAKGPVLVSTKAKRDGYVNKTPDNARSSCSAASSAAQARRPALQRLALAPDHACKAEDGRRRSHHEEVQKREHGRVFSRIRAGRAP